MRIVKPEPANPEPLPLSLLNDYLYCPRRAGLKTVEGYREENMHTVLGDAAHEHADLPGYEVAKGVLVWRALPVFSDRLGLSGKCDIVEASFPSPPASRSSIPHLPSAISHLPTPNSQLPAPSSLVPVEYKKGKRRQFENDDAQLCAQGLCLEEMFGISVERGAVFHAASKRRRDVVFTTELRASTEQAIAELHQLAGSGTVPPAEYRPACTECSLFEICLPKATGGDARIEREARRLYEIPNPKSQIRNHNS